MTAPRSPDRIPASPKREVDTAQASCRALGDAGSRVAEHHFWQRWARLANAAAWLAFVSAFAAGRWTSSMGPSIIAAFAFFAFGLISIHCPVRAKTILDPRH